uniref:Venom polypeptide n=1 Tax=Dolopus genitalis TaxID=2488630 RepID=A0A3G5BID3_DOLGE|nr:venom polypeptide [Dolopus genitalis]
MARFNFALACILLAAVCSAAPEIEKLQASIEFVDDISAYAAEFPEVDLIPLDSEVQPFGQIRYTLGGRVAGDRIVAQGNNNFNYPTLQDVRLTLNYPQSGVGAVVSFVEIVVQQTSNDGNAYIAAGGIGQRTIRIILEARRTQSFAYRAAIFGY